MIDSDAPELEDVIRAYVEQGVAQLHAAIPAVVVVYDPLTQRAQCQPALLKRILEPATGASIPSPTPSPSTPFLPVQWPSGGRAGGPMSPPTWGLTGPLNPGDPVTLLVRSRSCDEWQTAGVPGASLPLDPRRWAIQDAVVLPGHAPISGVLPPVAVDPASMVLYGTPASPVKLGTNVAVDAVLKGTTFEANLSTFLAAVNTFAAAALAAAGTVGNTDPGWVALGVAATNLQVATTAFQALVGSGIHQSTTARVST